MIFSLNFSWEPQLSMEISRVKRTSQRLTPFQIFFILLLAAESQGLARTRATQSNRRPSSIAPATVTLGSSPAMASQPTPTSQTSPTLQQNSTSQPTSALQAAPALAPTPQATPAPLQTPPPQTSPEVSSTSNTLPATSTGSAAEAEYVESPLDIFENVWEAGKNNIYPFNQILQFTESNYRYLRKKINEARTVEDIASILNPFLDEMKLSHTKLFTSQDLDFYYLKSVYGTHDPDNPKIHHIGVQLAQIRNSYYVRTVLDGHPAKKAGLRRGDKILKVNGLPFHPVFSFTDAKPKYNLTYERNGKTTDVKIKTVYSGLGRAYWDATSRSPKILKSGKKKVGYIHLWSGHFESDKLVSEIVEKKFLNKVDAIILDLRDGYGAASWNHLDPFYENRESYFPMTSITRYGDKKEERPDKKNNLKAFTKKLIVLINAGTRGTKEALAYQFKKSGRAQLVGVPTAGAMVADSGYFADQNKSYLFQLSSGGILIDGVELEKNSVKPDIHIDHRTTESHSHDPQLKKALSLVI